MLPLGGPNIHLRNDDIERERDRSHQFAEFVGLETHSVASGTDGLVGGNLPRYKRQLLSWLAPAGNYVLGHWGKKHAFDWLPIGPRRRSRARIEKLFSPELAVVEYEQDLMTEIPMPFGPTVMGMGFWFKRQ